MKRDYQARSEVNKPVSKQHGDEDVVAPVAKIRNLSEIGMPVPYDYLRSIDSLTDGQPSAQHQRSDTNYREEENFNIW